MANQPTSSINNIYLQRYATQEILISEPPANDLNLIITIPCYNEPDLLRSLISIDNCAGVTEPIEVIVLINDAENSKQHIIDQNQKALREAEEWKRSRKSNLIDFYFIHKTALPQKHAGVGLARKIAMDEAVRRFNDIGNQDGVIACFDADSQCDPNYIQSISNYFNDNIQSPGCSIYYEHPLSGDHSKEIYAAITDYELFLRFYTNALRFAQFPHAYQTVGSSMAVRSNAYQKQGGMPKRKAGEDFHFINKIIPLGNFGEVNNTRIIPSERTSDRVPFGTGKAVSSWLEQRQLLTYNPSSFEDLRTTFSQIDSLYLLREESLKKWLKKQPKSLRTFLAENKFAENINRLNSNSGSKQSFQKSFFYWFDAFKCMKYLHFSRDNFHDNVSINQAANWLLSKVNEQPPEHDNLTLLQKFRALDKQGHFLR